jgi:hypothetical protein
MRPVVGTSGPARCAAVLFFGSVCAQQDRPLKSSVLSLTTFLKHDRSKTLDEIIQAQLKKNGFYNKSPPEGVEVSHGTS